MLRKSKENRLIELAFGDASSEGRISKEEEKTVRAYACLRDDLDALKDIPDHQLSNERLREAILASGLTPSRDLAQDLEVRSENSWLVPSLGACAVIAMFVIGAHLRRPSTPAVIEEGSDPMARLEKSEITFPPISQLSPKAKRLPKPETVAVRKEQNEIANLTKVSHPRFHSMKPRSDARLSDRVDPSWLTVSVGPSLEDLGPVHERTSSPGDSVASAPPLRPLERESSPSDSKSIVEIESEKDEETGARSAKEVESRNVVVGG